MKYLLLLLVALTFTGCQGRMVTTTVHSVVNDRNLDMPIGHFEITQERYQSDRSAWSFDYRQFDHEKGSDIIVVFHNTCDRAVSFNFTISGKGWHLTDAVVNLSPNQTYTSQRFDAPYYALDYWRVNISNSIFNSKPKREIPSN